MLRLFFAIDTTNGFAEQAQIGMQAKLFTGGVVPGSKLCAECARNFSARQSVWLCIISEIQ